MFRALTDCDGGPLEPKGEGDATGGRAQVRAGRIVGVQRRANLQAEPGILQLRDPHVNARRSSIAQRITLRRSLQSELECYLRIFRT